MGLLDDKMTIPGASSYEETLDNLEGKERGIDFTRPLSEYPTAQTIVDFLIENPETTHIYTESLNQNGVAVQDAMEKYLEDDGLSSGMLKAALKSPLHFSFASSEDKEELEKMKGQAAHFNIGNYLHEAILEPTKFSRAIVEPSYSLASKEGVKTGIDFWEQIIIAKGFGVDEKGDQLTAQETLDLAMQDVTELGLSIEKQDGKKHYLKCLKAFSDMDAVTEENFLKIQILKKHYEEYGGGILQRLLKHSKREISMYWNETSTGRRLKIRPDAIQFKENIGVDAIISVKSSGIEDLRAFQYQAAKLHYDLSEGMYQEVASNVTGRDFNTTIMVILQTVAPFAIAILVWSAEDIETGKHKYRLGLDIADKALNSNSFPGYDSFAEEGNFGLIQLHLPQWNNKEFLPSSI